MIQFNISHPISAVSASPRVNQIDMPTHKTYRRRRPDRTAAAAVEFAIVATIFFLLVIAAFEFGRMNVIRHTADNAAYEAARHAMVPGATVAEARDSAYAAVDRIDFPGGFCRRDIGWREIGRGG